MANKTNSVSFPRLILFDGVCNFCNSWVNWVIRHDAQKRFKFVPIQSDLGATLYRESGLDPADPQTFVLLSGKTRHVKSSAVIEVVRQFGGAWRTAALLCYVPVMVRDGVYNIIARHRYRLFGRREYCVVPTEDIKGRFFTGEKQRPSPSVGSV